MQSPATTYFTMCLLVRKDCDVADLCSENDETIYTAINIGLKRVFSVQGN